MTHPDRTLLVTQNFPPAVGGTCTLFSNLYRHYPAGSLAVLTRHRQPADFPHPVRHASFAPSRRWKPVEFLALGASLLRPIAREKKGHGLAAVHAGSTIPEGVAGALARKLLGLRFVLWCHGEDVAQFCQYRVEKRLQRWMFRAADAVVANSENTRRLCVEHGAKPGRVVVVHPGVDVDHFRPRPDQATELRRRHGVGAGPLLVTVGRLQRRKGHDRVIEAVAALRGKYPGLRYWVVGGSSGADPADAETLRTMARARGLEEAVTFHGEVPFADLPAYYSAADLFAMPNRDINGDLEGFGQCFLEAAACGVTSVAGDSGGAPEAVVHGETGLLVDGDSPDAVTAGIDKLLDDVTRRTSLAAAAARRAASFAWPEVYKRFRTAVGGSA